ncbi:MAG: hypothetical protein NPMRIOTA_270003 [Nitrosopumilales archaeon]|nr:MAG: hypothetical protein NPMRIOTA_270003 [Nitrosopumilales archaeon]
MAVQKSYIIAILVTFLIAGTPAFSLSSLDRVLSSDPKIVNALGTEIDYLTIGNQYQITAKVSNAQDFEQDFVIIIQIKDPQNAVASISWVGGSLFPNQQLSSAVSWTPNSSGQYKVQIFVWDNLKNADALSPILEFSVVVN